MSLARENFRRVIAQDTCTLSANIFDPLSARIANMLGYEICVLSGSVGKVANLGVPDGVLTNMSDVVDHCRRITRIADVSLMVDAEDGFGNAVNVVRTVRELEAAGVSAIEIEDNFVPKRFNVENPGLVSKKSRSGSCKPRRPRGPTPRPLSWPVRPLWGSARWTRRWTGWQPIPRPAPRPSCSRGRAAGSNWKRYTG